MRRVTDSPYGAAAPAAVSMHSTGETRIIQRAYRGFTLVELMIVIAIIAILAAILIPNYMHARAQSHVSACVANEKQIATALEEYAVDHSGSYGASGVVTSTLLGTLYLGTTPRDPASGSNYSLTATSGSYGAYEILDAGNHDTTTTGGLSNGPGSGSILYDQM